MQDTRPLNPFRYMVCYNGEQGTATAYEINHHMTESGIKSSVKKDVSWPIPPNSSYEFKPAEVPTIETQPAEATPKLVGNIIKFLKGAD